MQNMKRIDCNVAIWWLDDLDEMILFIMINKKVSQVDDLRNLCI